MIFVLTHIVRFCTWTDAACEDSRILLGVLPPLLTGETPCVHQTSEESRFSVLFSAVAEAASCGMFTFIPNTKNQLTQILIFIIFLVVYFRKIKSW